MRRPQCGMGPHPVVSAAPSLKQVVQLAVVGICASSAAATSAAAPMQSSPAGSSTLAFATPPPPPFAYGARSRRAAPAEGLTGSVGRKTAPSDLSMALTPADSDGRAGHHGASGMSGRSRRSGPVASSLLRSAVGSLMRIRPNSGGSGSGGGGDYPGGTTAVGFSAPAAAAAAGAAAAGAGRQGDGTGAGSAAPTAAGFSWRREGRTSDTARGKTSGGGRGGGRPEVTSARGAGTAVGSSTAKFSWRRGEWRSDRVRGAGGRRGAGAAAAAAASNLGAGASARGASEATGKFSWRHGDRGAGGKWGRVDAASASASGASAAAASATGAAKEGGAADGGRGEGTVGGSEDSGKAGGVEGSASFKFGADLMADFKRRVKVYKSDWTDGFNRKSLPAIMFLYFACLLPAVAFGGIATQVTQGTLGVIEFVMSCGLGGMAYAMFSGQPMTFIGPTGLTLAFMTSLYSFTSVAGLPFLPVYAWVGLWTSAFLATLALVGASNLIEFATQFTDDVFNALLSVNFIYEAARSLMRNFSPAAAGYTQAGALMSFNVAIATYAGCRKTSGALSSTVFNNGFREFMSDFGPIVVILGMSTFCALPSWKGLLSFLEVPSAFMLCNGRSWLVPVFSVGPPVRFACALPAMLLTSLFFLDQNISARVVNSPRHKMVKGAAYHQDMLVLGIITGLLSLVGLPWQCAATVQSLNHVRQMATFETTPGQAAGGGSRSETIESIHETRLTGFCVHVLVLGSLALLPQLAKIPMAVVSGIFLYLGRKVMSGNGFLIRCKEAIVDRNLLPEESDYRKVGFGTAAKYTMVQAAMLTLLWTLKSFKRTALFFPSVIGLLIVVRLVALPKMFSSKELSELDAAVG